jgi:Tol biopolymer transport system component
VTNGTDPEWSPDSSAIAYSQGGVLMLLPQTAPDVFGAPAPLGGAGNYDWHPTWSPDSQWLAYQHGAGCSTSTRSGAYVAGALWLISRDGKTNVPLANLNGGRMDNWRPVLSPFDSGGYYWVVYSTARPYGNATAGISGQKQLWISAIHNKPMGTTDPSEVPYYMDGQEPVTNLQSYWAPAPCQVYQGQCETDGQCCSTQCNAGKCGTPMVCHTRGESCATDSDCCAIEVLSCLGNLCEQPVIR